MNNIAQKLEYLKWLKLIGIEYYFSPRKDSPSGALEDHTVEKKRHKRDEMDNMNNNQDNQPLPHDLLINKDSRKLADSANSLDQLKEMVMNFNGCSLKNFATNTVFADGVPEAKIMFIGEAPGAREDELGVPFCGESGMLLDTMLSTINLSRKENIYITNTIFWRPPANRKPTREEMDICKPFLEKHIALINPKLLVCVGSTALNGLFGDKLNITTARNNNYFYQNQYLSKPITTMAIFHPAYLLRQPNKKKDTWFNLIKIQQFIEENL